VQIIALTEVNTISSLANSFDNVLGIKGARMTLRREGIALYLFVLCSEEHLQYKSAYYKLLICIKRRRPAFSADIGGKHQPFFVEFLYSQFVQIESLHSCLL
jgi:hypothetical protein